jgi:hypothetical protein
MLTYDYLVKDPDSNDWKYVKDSITAGDAVLSAFSEGVILSSMGSKTWVFTGLRTGKKYVVNQVDKVFLVTAGEYEEYRILSAWSKKEDSERYMKCFSDEEAIKVEELIVDDPRNICLWVSEDESLYEVWLNSDYSLIHVWWRYKTVSNIMSLNKGVFNDTSFGVTVATKSKNEAVEKARELLKKHIEGDKNEGA